jgi:lipopolysaccharide export system protein LptA
MSCRLIVIVLAGFTLAPGGLQATDNPPIDISAQDSSYDVVTGEWRFEGQVRIVYGTVHVHGDRGVVQQEGERFTRIEISGSPAAWQETLEDGSEVAGEALEISFDVERQVLVMAGNTRVQHPRGVYRSDRLVYDLASRTLSGHAEDDGRVRMTIEPARPQRDD